MFSWELRGLTPEGWNPAADEVFHQAMSQKKTGVSLPDLRFEIAIKEDRGQTERQSQDQ